MSIGEQALHQKGVKDDKGKPELGTFGATKYTRGGWQSVPDGINRYTAAMGRHHLLESIDASSIDPETELLHATAVAWNALARLELILREQEQLESQS